LPSIQTTENTAPTIPLRPGQLERHTHNYNPPRHHQPLCRLGYQGRHVDRRSASPAPQHRVPSPPGHGRAGHASRPGATSGAGQPSIHKTPRVHRWLVRHPRVLHARRRPPDAAWWSTGSPCSPHASSSVTGLAPH